MTVDEFQILVNQIASRLGIVPVYSHEGEVAHIGDDEFELHRSGIVRRCRYLYPQPVAENIAKAILLQQADRRGPFMRRSQS
ncbi:hypothetical protein [Lacipirellula sp.]|uniref:hypothetical protein n=1 Tax=Lacipirellula sp. TaxID=2691419 RepID=UPI003D0F65BA